MRPPIPDPLEPEKCAIDGDTGEILRPVYMAPKGTIKNFYAPTLAELQDGAVHVGWARPGVLDGGAL